MMVSPILEEQPMSAKKQRPRIYLPKTISETSAITAPQLDLSHLTLNSTLADLPTHAFQVSAETSAILVATEFDAQPDLPGVIVMQNDKILGVISRRRFMEQIGRPYGIEVYLYRSIQVMLEATGTNSLKLPGACTIHFAAEIALRRKFSFLYDPIIVEFPDKSLRLLNSYTLLLAQSQLLNLVYQVEQSRRQLAESLEKTGRILSSSLNLQEVTARILVELAHVVSYERGLIMLKKGTVLQKIAQRGFPPHLYQQELTVPIQTNREDVFQRIVATQKPLLVDNVRYEPGWQQLEGLPLDHSWVGVPLVVQNQVIGLISLTRREPYAFRADDVLVVQTFAGQAVIALENARLYDEIMQFKNQLEGMVSERTEELNKAYATLAQLDKTKSDFIKVSAHELRTPLTVVKGYAQVLASDEALQSSAQTKMVLDGMLSGVDRLYQIVNDMLDIAKIDSNALRVHPESVVLAEMIQHLGHKLHKSLQDRSLNLFLHNLETLPAVYGDSDLLLKVFHGLLVNGIKYTPDGGAITVSGREVWVNGRSFVEIKISDTGIGIDPAKQELIFEKFYQTGELALHSSGYTKFKGGGPGLGLAIAKGIVLAHNGRIWVESEGCDEQTYPGSHFYVHLPTS